MMPQPAYMMMPGLAGVVLNRGCAVVADRGGMVVVDRGCGVNPRMARGQPILQRLEPARSECRVAPSHRIPIPRRDPPRLW
jgi:hypothetical protein